MKHLACYHPLKGFAVGQTAKKKTQYKICSYDVNTVLIPIDGGTTICTIEENKWTPGYKTITEYTDIPCGQCIGCRLDYSKQWANRCMLELEYHEKAYFATMTYAPEEMPISYYAKNDNGEAQATGTLDKRDLQLFFKRLRKKQEEQIRYYAVGEYGTEFERPHYHAIIYGLDLPDLTFHHKGKNGFPYYKSQIFENAWKKGICDLTTVSWDTCAYVARYMTKKLKGNEGKKYEITNIEPPFSLMSRKPGIARQWFDDHPDCYDYDYINLTTAKGGKKIKHPRYYDALYDIKNPEEMKKIKEIRKEIAKTAKELKLKNTTLTYQEILAIQERSLQEKIKILEREL